MTTCAPFPSALSALFALLLVGLPVSAEPLKVSRDPRALGLAVLRELSIRDGKLAFRVDSGGCTDARSFKVRVAREDGVAPQVPHFRLAIERVRADECKAMLWEGVLIELDLSKDLGLEGAFSVSVANPVLPEQGVAP